MSRDLAPVSEDLAPVSGDLTPDSPRISLSRDSRARPPSVVGSWVLAAGFPERIGGGKCNGLEVRKLYCGAVGADFGAISELPSW